MMSGAAAVAAFAAVGCCCCCCFMCACLRRLPRGLLAADEAAEEDVGTTD